MSKLKDFLLNILLIILVIIMIILMVLNWSSGLNFNNVSDDFFAKNFITSIAKSTSNDIGSDDYFNLKTANKIAYKTADATYGATYDKIAYETVSTHIYELFESATNLENSTQTEYLSAFENDEYVILEYYAPLCAIASNSIDTYVSNMVIIQNSSTSTAYIKSQDSYYKYSQKIDEINYIELQNLDQTHEVKISQNGTVNIVSNSSVQASLLNFLPIILSDNTNILSQFLYNPDILDSYQTFDDKTTYINAFSTLTIGSDKIEFKTTDSRGNLTSKNATQNNTALITFALNIFDNIYTEIGSELTGFCSDIYYSDNQTIVTISTKFDDIEVDTETVAGIFKFSGNNLSSCEINLFRAQDAFTKVNMARTSVLNTEQNIVLIYTLRGNPAYRYLSPKE